MTDIVASKPDKCQMLECTRKGIPGNENVIDDLTVFDYCHVRLLNGEKLHFMGKLSRDGWKAIEGRATS